MAEYHVGLGMSAIYAGTLNKAGDMWKSKSDVTKEAIKAVFVHLVEEAEVEKPGDEYTITYPSSEYELVIRRKKNERIELKLARQMERIKAEEG